jgi:hypothetical protein
MCHCMYYLLDVTTTELRSKTTWVVRKRNGMEIYELMSTNSRSG